MITQLLCTYAYFIFQELPSILKCCLLCFRAIILSGTKIMLIATFIKHPLDIQIPFIANLQSQFDHLITFSHILRLNFKAF